MRNRCQNHPSKLLQKPHYKMPPINNTPQKEDPKSPPKNTTQKRHQKDGLKNISPKVVGALNTRQLGMTDTLMSK